VIDTRNAEPVSTKLRSRLRRQHEREVLFLVIIFTREETVLVLGVGTLSREGRLGQILIIQNLETVEEAVDLRGFRSCGLDTLGEGPALLKGA